MRHSNIGTGYRHAIHNWEFADASARTANGNYSANDVGKIALQNDDGSFYRLTNTGPGWQAISGGNASTTTPGSVRLATVAEAGRGVVTDAAVTPAGLFPAIENVASAANTNLANVNSSAVRITGTTNIESLGTGPAGLVREGYFTGALTLVHDAANLILPTGSNLTTSANDRFRAHSLGAGSWIVLDFMRANGAPVGTVGVTPGSYSSANITVDAFGRVTAASNGSGGGGGSGTKTIATLLPLEGEAPAGTYATFNVVGNRPVLEFDHTQGQSMFWTKRVPEGANLASGLNVFLQWAHANATAGSVGWNVAFERVAPSGLNIANADFGTPLTITAVAVHGTVGVTKETNVGFAQANLPANLAAGETYRVKITRDVANDDAAGNAQLLSGEIRLV